MIRIFWNLTFVFLAFITISSCRPDDFPRRQFPTCDPLAADLVYTPSKLTCVFKLNPVTANLASIEWDFGDGSKQTNLETSETHTYRQAGTYTVKVTITDKCKNALTRTLTFTVSDRILPTLVAIVPTVITQNSASVGIMFSNLGNPSPTQYGVCYSYTNSDPLVGNSTVKYFSGQPSLNTVLSDMINSLQHDTVYYLKAFAINADGVAYSSIITFRTKADITSGLVAYLPFNGNPFDATSYKNDALLGDETVGRSNYTENSDGVPGSAFRFNGSTYLKIIDNPSLRLRTQSISFWFKPEVIPSSTNQYLHLLYKANYDKDTNQEFSTSVDWNSASGVRFKADVKQNSDCQSGKGWESLIHTINLKAEWYHVVILCMSNKIVMYINGEYFFEKSLPYNTGIDSCIGGDLIIGAQSNKASNFYRGALDELRVYNTILTQNQISALYNK